MKSSFYEKDSVENTIINPKSGFVPESKAALATDLYQLTMSRGYFETGKQNEIATFDLFVRKLPDNRSYLLVAGLEQSLWYLTEGLKFDQESIKFLQSKNVFKDAPEEFWKYLESFEFSGDVWAMPEGMVAFGMEPLMTVSAPIIEAQIAETYLLTQYNHQTKIASKAARCVQAAQRRPIIEFGMRRTDIGASARAARAAYIGGAIGSSNVVSDYMFGVPSFGTHAHSWIMSFASEQEAFDAYFQVYGKNTVALIDTYDTVEGAKKATKLSGDIKGVRLDSGDLCELSKDVRKVLDKNGKGSCIIFASSDLNEYKIEQMLQDGAKIDAFGVGTELILSKDEPTLGGVYKLAEIQTDRAVHPKIKLSKNKATLPGKKQVFRAYQNGKYKKDIIGLRNENFNDLEKLLVPVIQSGKLIYNIPALSDVQKFSAANISKLPSKYKQVKVSGSYSVGVSARLQELTDELASTYHNQEVII
jgi:nicotinate phosphoribosyltransferase